MGESELGFKGNTNQLESRESDGFQHPCGEEKGHMESHGHLSDLTESKDRKMGPLEPGRKTVLGVGGNAISCSSSSLPHSPKKGIPPPFEHLRRQGVCRLPNWNSFSLLWTQHLLHSRLSSLAPKLDSEATRPCLPSQTDCSPASPSLARDGLSRSQKGRPTSCLVSLGEARKWR